MITENAKKLIEIIGREYALQLDRVGSRYIPARSLMPITVERLQLKARKNKELRIFLETGEFISRADDERMDRDWAKDPREIHDQVVSEGITINREQRARDEELGLVPAAVHTVPSGT